MDIFLHPFTDIEKLSIVISFEPEKFPSISRLGITLHIGGKGEEKNLLSIYKRSNACCWKENIEKKNGVPKAVKLTPLRNMSKQKQSENAGKGTQKKCRRKMN